MEFKAGDKVCFVGEYTNHGKYVEGELSLEKLVKKYKNEFTVSHTIGDYIGIKEGIFWCFTKDELELIPKKFSKKDLRAGDIVTFRNGEKRILDSNNCYLYGEKQDASDYVLIYINKYNEELMYEDSKEYDIILIERVVRCNRVFPVEIKERMTKEEAQQEFKKMGKLIEII